MKLKQRPEDFIVREVPAFTPDPRGRHFVYEVKKRNASTFDVLEILRKAMRLGPRDTSSGGLKDKHAVTTQLIALSRPLPGGFHHELFDAHFVGKSARPLTAANVGGNRFEIIARSLTSVELDGLERNIACIRQFGVPNYYDSQRFGGGGAEELPGRPMVAGNYEEALRLHLAVPRRKQPLQDKRIRRICAAGWGKWEEVLADLPQCRERSAIAHLVKQPGDFAGALLQTDPALLQLYLSAYQSLLFNRTLSEFIRTALSKATLAGSLTTAGEMLFWTTLEAGPAAYWRVKKLPLLATSSDAKAWDSETKRAVDVALASEGLTLEGLRVSGLEGLRLRPAERSVAMIPKEFTVTGPEDDELNAGRLKISVAFELPRGCFATVVMKRLGVRLPEDAAPRVAVHPPEPVLV